jgi:hypothetical protein
MTNLFGIDITAVDVATFERVVRLAFVTLTLVGAARAWKASEGGAARAVFFVAVVGHTAAWFATMFLLPNVYGANGSMDRENHLGWANVMALGFSPLRTFQVEHIHFEPLWPLLTAIASGFDVGRVPLVFQVAPWIIGLALLASMRFAWFRGFNANGTNTDVLTAVFAALGGVLLIAVPEDSWGTFRNPWALTFLLKPNHALGLVLTPLALLSIARARDLKSRFLAGFMLQLVGWAFIIHMALLIAGLAVFVVLSWMSRRDDRREDLVNTGVAVGVNVLIVSPYLLMLIVGYPFLRGNAPYPAPFFSDRTLEGVLQPGLLFVLAALGARHAYREGSRFGRLAACQWITAQAIWLSFPFLGLIGQAREQDEAFYWCRFWTGIFAGVGLVDLLRRLARPARGFIPHLPQGAVGTAALLVALPSLLPAYWSPQSMDLYFVAARKPLPRSIAEPTAFIRASTPTESVFAGDRSYARWIAAYGARRVLVSNSLNSPKDRADRDRAEGAILRGHTDPDTRSLAERYGIRYVLMTSRPLDQASEISIEDLTRTPGLRAVFDRDYPDTRVAIFEVLR